MYELRKGSRSFFCTWQSSCTGTIYWKEYCFHTLVDNQLTINCNALLNTQVIFQSYQPIFHFKILNILLNHFPGLIKQFQGFFFFNEDHSAITFWRNGRTVRILFFQAVHLESLLLLLFLINGKDEILLGLTCSNTMERLSN